ncbi:hypothetical protein A2V55_02165 [Candidatus Woesebacteria bacterium RBG_19FT_COMBO_37_29]|uniref:Uncharacterized protein n=1 Tax=Candidatus Woesebacteria bacterium RBG_19FT_COMBO_37_29 TaxID=1802486 RepID=A0A1F7XPV9_9BACT|nr:MAG: hypothetical protein A2V55_02165 [Candidatus Woesebacteria bacterium RBG_19FT_COMBO_37_29]
MENELRKYPYIGTEINGYIRIEGPLSHYSVKIRSSEIVDREHPAVILTRSTNLGDAILNIIYHSVESEKLKKLNTSKI